MAAQGAARHEALGRARRYGVETDAVGRVQQIKHQSAAGRGDGKPFGGRQRAHKHFRGTVREVTCATMWHDVPLQRDVVRCTLKDADGLVAKLYHVRRTGLLVGITDVLVVLARILKGGRNNSYCLCGGHDEGVQNNALHLRVLGGVDHGGRGCAARGRRIGCAAAQQRGESPECATGTNACFVLFLLLLKAAAELDAPCDACEGVARVAICVALVVVIF
mmetsp:Transcript_6323/g.23359  ORF Transcript_6323/g.23359 Transcript_6323/m.23359 type:complete len:220 (+) Transcript_6323:687-1346(+)